MEAARDTGKGCSRGHQRRFSVQGRFPTLACAEAARDTSNGTGRLHHFMVSKCVCQPTRQHTGM